MAVRGPKWWATDDGRTLAQVADEAGANANADDESEPPADGGAPSDDGPRA